MMSTMDPCRRHRRRPWVATAAAASPAAASRAAAPPKRRRTAGSMTAVPPLLRTHSRRQCPHQPHTPPSRSRPTSGASSRSQEDPKNPPRPFLTERPIHPIQRPNTNNTDQSAAPPSDARATCTLCGWLGSACAAKRRTRRRGWRLNGERCGVDVDLSGEKGEEACSECSGKHWLSPTPALPSIHPNPQSIHPPAHP